MCTPANTIVNQLTTAKNPATAPSRPPSPNDVVVDESFREPPANPRPTPPTRLMCGIARISRKNVVTRFLFSIAGTTVTDTGYDMRRDYTETGPRWQPLGGITWTRRGPEYCPPRSQRRTPS